jgi:hypothetical protein
MLHRIRHWLHLQPIVVVSEWRGLDLWIGAQCVVCGEITGWHRSRVTRPPEPLPRAVWKP